MRSFLFCTSYVGGTGGGQSFERWRRWIDYYSPRRELFGAERLFLIDDGTPVEDLPPGLSIVAIGETLPELLPEGPVMLRFPTHYGRSSLHRFPGWWRSFSFASQIARRYGYSKIIHCESDAFVLSRRMANHIEALAEGWTAFWCPRHKIPESSIQVICGASIAALERLYRGGEALWFQKGPLARFRAYAPRLGRTGFRHDYAGLLMMLLTPRTAEFVLPFDAVSKVFVGDRYGESEECYPDGADYVCQAAPGMRFENALRAEASPEAGEGAQRRREA